MPDPTPGGASVPKLKLQETVLGHQIAHDQDILELLAESNAHIAEDKNRVAWRLLVSCHHFMNTKRRN